MRRSEIDIFLSHWGEGFAKIFTLKQEFMPNEYLVIRRNDELYKLEDTTSKTFTSIDKDKIIELMGKEELIFYDAFSTFVNIIELKTGGCTMGCWILGQDVNHDPNCALSKYSNGWRR